VIAPFKAVTVYCSSSNACDAAFFQAARDLGAAIANSGWKLIYGGNSLGLMQAVADAARAAGGKVLGVTPRLLVDKGAADTLCELIVTDDMRQRKALMEEHGDAFIALPGGLGTFEEIFEIIVSHVLGFHVKPVILLNIAGYYDPLLAMIDHGIEHGFIKPKARRHFQVFSAVPPAIDYLRRTSTAL